MRFIALSKPNRHKYGYGKVDEHGDRIHLDKVALLENCRDYIDDKKKEGTIESVYWTFASKETKAFWYLNVDSTEILWEILEEYPAFKELNLHWQVMPLNSCL